MKIAIELKRGFKSFLQQSEGGGLGICDPVAIPKRQLI